VGRREMERLNRGLVAVRAGGGIYLGWRLFATDPDDIAFHLYRDGVRIHDAPLRGSTNYLDRAGGLAATYELRAVVGGVEQPGRDRARVWARNHLAIPLRRPEGGVTPDGAPYVYHANDASVGDLDGDGEYEIVLKWDPSNSRDNAHAGYTGRVYLDAYKLDGSFLWRIDLGVNIRAGAHYTQFIVYDLDGDGRAEVVCKTADGTVDGRGVVLGDGRADYRNPRGYVLDGPEYLTIFEGATGRALACAGYEPPRGRVSDWGDDYGNRVDRFLACVAYLDGRRPHLVMCRGYYTRTVLVAYTWRGGRLSRVWTFDSADGRHGCYAGQGCHSLSVADVDGDGRDEIVYGSAVIDHDGRGLYATGLGHGDALHVGDLDPDRPGLEVFQVHETPSACGVEMHDARTGEVLWGLPTTGDVGRGLCADIDPRHRGEECWAAGRLYTCRGEPLGAAPPSVNFAVWWDGDLLRELLDHNRIEKWDYVGQRLVPLLTADGCVANNGTKATPCLQADILGDWREEVVWRTADDRELRIYTTTELTPHRLYTLMHDPTYRLAVAWQNVGYNQPPHPGFYLGDGMAAPPRPDIAPVDPQPTPGR
jgi:hypothetical protein